MGDKKKQRAPNDQGRGKKKDQVRKGRDLEKWKNNRPKAPAGCIRVIGGIYRGATLLYSGDQVTRPMKDNVREALFNLVGGYLQETICFDLFAGTGAVGLEALSRKAKHAILVERHVPTSKIIRQNVESLEVESSATICCSDTFFWVREFNKHLQQQKSTVDALDFETLANTPWAIFCCPPYDLFVDEWEKLKGLIETFLKICPPQSLIVVETDSRFDPALLPVADAWVSRQYSPAILSVWKKEPTDQEQTDQEQADKSETENPDESATPDL